MGKHALIMGLVVPPEREEAMSITVGEVVEWGRAHGIDPSTHVWVADSVAISRYGVLGLTFVSRSGQMASIARLDKVSAGSNVGYSMNMRFSDLEALDHSMELRSSHMTPIQGTQYFDKPHDLESCLFLLAGVPGQER